MGNEVKEVKTEAEALARLAQYKEKIKHDVANFALKIRHQARPPKIKR